MTIQLEGPYSVGGCVAIFQWKMKPSTDLWLCKHQIGYPDVCDQCAKEENNERTY